MNQTECPYCKAINQIGQAGAGHTLQCAACHRTFMATSITATTPAVESPTPAASNIPAVPMYRPATTGPSGPPAGGGGVPGSASGAMGQTPVAGQVPRAIPVSATPTRAATPVSAVEKPLVTDRDSPRDSPRDSSHGASRGGSRNSNLMWWLGGVMCFVIGGLLLVVVFLAGDRRQPTRPSGGNAGPNVVHLTPSKSRRSGWADASGNTVVSISKVAVEVDYVEYGEVRAKDASRRVIVSDAKDYLQVFLTITNHDPRAFRYASWYGNTFDSGGQSVAASLVDDQGRSYEMREFGSVSGVRGHTEQANLTSRESVSDVVIFAIPSTLNRREIRYFRLELPAEAYGGSGIYRFEIPHRAVQGF